jgi:hypothetical protein
MAANVTITVSKKSLAVGALVASISIFFAIGLAVTPCDEVGESSAAHC